MLNIINTVDDNRKESLLALLAYAGMHDVKMIEVGSYTGESADVFASSGLVKKLLCVDPWVGGYDNNDPISRSDYLAVEAIFDSVMNRSGGKISKFKGTLQQLKEAGLEYKPDLVYIDANHIYEHVLSDIKTALELAPCVIAGHDYGGHQRGVMQAVDELLGKPDIVFKDSSWLVSLERKLSSPRT